MILELNRDNLKNNKIKFDDIKLTDFKPEYEMLSAYAHLVFFYDDDQKIKILMNNTNKNKVLLGKSKKHVLTKHPLILKLLAIKKILFNRNFILIHGIKEFIDIPKQQKGRQINVICSTIYDNDSDYLSCLGAAKICEKYDKQIYNQGT